MDVLPLPGVERFDAIATDCIRQRLRVHGPPPWSICEARLTEQDYRSLLTWASQVTEPRLQDDAHGCDLVLISLVAEWNRRNSPGDRVFGDVASVFGVGQARARLFGGNGQPTSFFKRVLQRACNRFDLRHAFHVEVDESFPNYLTLQLQYGFSLPHVREQLRHWLRGANLPKVAALLLQPDGRCRSESFSRLVRDMKSYRQNRLEKSTFRRTLRESPWILPAWEDELVSLIDSVPREAGEDAPEFGLLHDPRVIWEDGPEIWCRLHDLPERLTDSRYVVRSCDRELARFYRRHDGSIAPDRKQVRIPLDGPEALVTLETPDGEIVEVQTIHLWNPDLPVQTRPLNRETAEASPTLLPGEQALITSCEADIAPRSTAWRVVGTHESRRRWWLVDGSAPIRVEDGGLVWTGAPTFSAADGFADVAVRVEGLPRPYSLGDLIRLRVSAPDDVVVDSAVYVGTPASFDGPDRRRTLPIDVRSEMGRQRPVRIGVRRGGRSAVVQKELDLKVRALIWADDGSELAKNRPLCRYDATHRPVQLLSDGPSHLLEGRQFAGTLAPGRVGRIQRLLGTGQELLVADRQFNTEAYFLAAPSTVDNGVARELKRSGREFRLQLFRRISPSDRHRLILWSPDRGAAAIDRSCIAVEGDGAEWRFESPWEADAVAVAVAYDGERLGAAWCGGEQAFYDADSPDGRDALSRIALIRWFRLPALRMDPESRQRPLIARLTRFTVEMARVALLDAGLPDDLSLKFDETNGGDSLFDIVFREAFFSYAPDDVGTVFERMPNEIDRLLTHHPFLGCRVLRSVLPRLLQQSRPHTRGLLTSMRHELLSLKLAATWHEIQESEADFLRRACVTFSERGQPINEAAVREGLVKPALASLFHNQSLESVHRDNLRSALGAASFREFLAAKILGRILEENA